MRFILASCNIVAIVVASSIIIHNKNNNQVDASSGTTSLLRSSRHSRNIATAAADDDSTKPTRFASLHMKKDSTSTGDHHIDHVTEEDRRNVMRPHGQGPPTSITVMEEASFVIRTKTKPSTNIGLQLPPAAAATAVADSVFSLHMKDSSTSSTDHHHQHHIDHLLDEQQMNAMMRGKKHPTASREDTGKQDDKEEVKSVFHIKNGVFDPTKSSSTSTTTSGTHSSTVIKDHQKQQQVSSSSHLQMKGSYPTAATTTTTTTIDSDFEINIVGGEEANVGEFPFYVNMWRCGGTLIGPDVILGAAHCGNYVGEVVNIAGSSSNSMIQIVAEKFNLNDLALYRLASPVDISSSAAGGSGGITMTLNTDPSQPEPGQDLVVIGTGLTWERGIPTNTLQKAVVQAFSDEDCRAAWNRDIPPEHMLCAGAADKGACVGDTGGPIFLRNGNDHVIIGVVSWGGGCTDLDLPTVYARVSSVTTWISKVACDEWGTSVYGLCINESPTFVPSETSWPSSTINPTYNETETEIPEQTQVPDEDETDWPTSTTNPTNETDWSIPTSSPTGWANWTTSPTNETDWSFPTASPTPYWSNMTMSPTTTTTTNETEEDDWLLPLDDDWSDSTISPNETTIWPMVPTESPTSYYNQTEMGWASCLDTTPQPRNIACTLVKVEFQTDDRPEETLILLEDTNSSSTIWDCGGFEANLGYSFSRCIPNDGCTLLDLTDTGGDGFLNSGFLKVTYGCKTLYDGGRDVGSGLKIYLGDGCA